MWNKIYYVVFLLLFSSKNFLIFIIISSFINFFEVDFKIFKQILFHLFSYLFVLDFNLHSIVAKEYGFYFLNLCNLRLLSWPNR